MRHDDVMKAVFEVQKAAESTHAASAVMGVQRIIEERARDKHKKNISTLTNFLQFARTNGRFDDEMKDAIVVAASAQLAEITAAYNEDYRNMEPKLYFAYSDFETNAGRTIADKSRQSGKPPNFTIVLSRRLQQILDDSRVNGLIEWNVATKQAKKSLQKTTLHELAHTVLPLFKQVDDAADDEHDAINFQTKLSQIQSDRNSELYRQEAFSM